MKKFLMLLLILMIAPILAGLYGVIHDQFTYSLSHEYFTKFKFYQFELMDVGDEAIFPNPRLQVATVGLLASWWLGIPIGLVLGLEGLRHKNAKTMFSVTFKAFLITLLVTAIIGMIGFLYGYFYLRHQPIEYFTSWYIPDNIIDIKSFINTGAVHNFSYIGGLIGLVVGLIYSLKVRRRNKREDIINPEISAKKA